jgi:hypothetical protein
MANLKNIRFVDFGKPEIILDWDNDRHQGVRLSNTDQKGVITALHQMIELLKGERNRREI